MKPITPTLKIDFHCHSNYSDDSLSRVNDLVETARSRGLDRLVIADHNTIQGAMAAKTLDPELVIVGEEILTSRGEILACFVQEEIPAGLEPAEVIRRLRAQSAFISVSHPFDIRRSGWEQIDLEMLAPLVDAVEVFNARCLYMEYNQQAADFARLHRLAGTVGSDAHALYEIGTTYLEVPHFTDAESLKLATRSGKSQATLSSPLVHLASTYARFYKIIYGEEEK